MSNGPSQSAFLDCLGEYTEIRFQQMRWASRAAKCLDTFERLGGDRDDIRDGFDLGKLSGEERQAEVRRQMRVAAYMGVTTWSENGQSSFAETFDMVDTLGAGGAPIGSRLSIARAHVDGYNSGKAGGDESSCPFAAESEEAHAWEDGFADGVEDRRERKPRAAKEADPDAPPKKRGRKPGSKNAPPVVNEATPEPPPPVH